MCFRGLLKIDAPVVILIDVKSSSGYCEHWPTQDVHHLFRSKCAVFLVLWNGNDFEYRQAEKELSSLEEFLALITQTVLLSLGVDTANCVMKPLKKRKEGRIEEKQCNGGADQQDLSFVTKPEGSSHHQTLGACSCGFLYVPDRSGQFKVCFMCQPQYLDDI